MAHKVVLRFDDVSVAEANRYAEELSRDLQDALPDIDITRRRDDPRSQDFGATLGVVLAGPAVVAFARGVAKWLARQNAVSITLEDDKGRLIAKNLESKDAAAVIQARLGASTTQ